MDIVLSVRELCKRLTRGVVCPLGVLTIKLGRGGGGDTGLRQ